MRYLLIAVGIVLQGWIAIAMSANVRNWLFLVVGFAAEFRPDILSQFPQEDPMTLTEWLIANDACDLEWAKGKTPRRAWDQAPADYLVWAATRPGVLDDRTLRRFACWCVRQVWHLLTDPRSRHAVEVAERFMAGQATNRELAAAHAAAYAASAAAYAAAYAASDADCAAAYAASAAASAAAYAAAYAASDADCAAAYAASAAARAAARAAAWDAAWDAARAAARAAARDDQTAWLRGHATPNWALVEDTPCATS